MELDEMKTAWAAMSTQIEKQNKLTSTLIMKMTQTQYKNKIRNIFIPELLGAIICLAEAILIAVNYAKLDTWYFLTAGIISAMLLLLLPVLSLRSISKMQAINIAGNNYKQTLIEYAQGKKEFFRVQKISYYLGFVLLIVLVPVMAKIFDGDDILAKTKIWIWTIPFGLIFMFFFAKWVYRYYRKNTLEAANLIEQLDRED